MQKNIYTKNNKKILIFTTLGTITTLGGLTPFFISCQKTNKEKNDYEGDFKLFYSELKKYLTSDYGFEWDDKNNKINIIVEPIKRDYNTNDIIIQRQISRAIANSPFNKQVIETNHPSTFYSINIVLNKGNSIIKKEVGFNIVVNNMFYEFYEKMDFSKWIKNNNKDFKIMLKDEKDKNKIINIVKSQFFEYLKGLKNSSINIDFEKKIKVFNFQIEENKFNFMYELITNDGTIHTRNVEVSI